MLKLNLKLLKLQIKKSLNIQYTPAELKFPKIVRLLYESMDSKGQKL